MNIEQWIVKKDTGEEWGFIKRLIIDSRTRQISYADVVVLASGHVARLPWETFDMHGEHIKLTVPEGKIQGMALGVPTRWTAETVTMEVWP